MKSSSRLLLSASLAAALLQAGTAFSFVGLSSMPGAWRWIAVFVFLTLSFGLLLLVRIRLRFWDALFFCLVVAAFFALLMEGLGWTIHRGLRHDVTAFSAEHATILANGFLAALGAAVAALALIEAVLRLTRRARRGN